MILDPTDQFIRHIAAHCDIKGKTVLEVGCGKGRVTVELARHARKVVAVDPDESLLQAARSLVGADNVEFVLCGGESLFFPESSFDIVVYSPCTIFPSIICRTVYGRPRSCLGQRGRSW